MSEPGTAKRKEWELRAAQKNAIVPYYFEVSPEVVFFICGKCKTKIQRNLIPHIDEPTFVCPNKSCKAKNWVPVKYNLKY